MIMFMGVVEALARVVAEVVKGLASAVLPLRSYRKRGGINENASVCGLFDSYRVRHVIARVSRRSSWGWGVSIAAVELKVASRVTVRAGHSV
jgi:hypothetical protein